MSDWKPISEAPKDGTEIIGRETPDEAGYPVYWHEKRECWWSCCMKVPEPKEFKLIPERTK